ncbi:TonB-dependent receptor plug domain-containing protein [uncultured Desulfuromusa sp.]|uniref:TonB-dependent receptor plug domain-containing protein n=1 Tax=uncultured Desulfuromusa sp. TaxID=219183 RepID=UPI00374805A3
MAGQLKYAPSIRGLYSDYSTRSSTAGLFIDGVPVTDGTGFDETLLDIERIEVLKGPQGDFVREKYRSWCGQCHYPETLQ